MWLSIFRGIAVPWEANDISEDRDDMGREAEMQVICEFIPFYNLHDNEAFFIQNRINRICRQVSKWQATAKIIRYVDV
jgi:hypothetical protein